MINTEVTNATGRDEGAIGMSLSKNPKCRHCGYELDDEETWYGEFTVGRVHTGDCEDSELTCPNIDCRMKFHVRCVHEMKFQQTTSEGEEV